MATNDRGFNPVGTAEGFAVGNIASRAGLPFMPSFYNSRYSNPAQGFANSEFNQMIHGNGDAGKAYLRRQADSVAGGLIGGAVAGPLGAFAGKMVAPWVDRHVVSPIFNWVKDKIGTVGGQPATVTPEATTSGDTTINPWTGAPMPNFSNGTTGSTYGPMANNYSGQPTNPDQGFVMPDFSHYGDLDQFDAPPKEKLKDRMLNGGSLPGFYGVSNFIANGQPVITGFNGGLQGSYNRMGGSNQGVVRGRDPGN